MENVNYEIISNGDIKNLNIINDYIKTINTNQERVKDCVELSENSYNKIKDINSTDNSFIIINNKTESDKEENENYCFVDKDNSKICYDKSVNDVIDEIRKKEKLVLSCQKIKRTIIKRVNFKELLSNVTNLHKETRKLFRLKRHFRKKKD